ncbi:hypothetical protein TrLO_g9850 [Triparma laevis f. longispina]|nr:hypothetical protein TrLO_g9850 [Triparma laevis f. longispina]
MHTPEFKYRFIEYVHPVTLLVLRRVCKLWQSVAESYIKELMEHGVLVLHQGEDTSAEVAISTAWKGMMKLVTQMSFLQNVTQIRVHACYFAVNLVVVDIPEGVERIGGGAFGGCISLTTASFPSTLK